MWRGFIQKQGKQTVPDRAHGVYAKPQVAEMCPSVYSQQNSIQGLGKQKGQVGAVNHVARRLRA